VNSDQWQKVNEEGDDKDKATKDEKEGGFLGWFGFGFGRFLCH